MRLNQSGDSQRSTGAAVSSRARLRDETGIALIMALGMLLVLTIALTATMELSSGSARHASSSNAGQSAYALAESGINNTIAVLFAGKTLKAGAANDASDPGFLPSRTSTDSTGSVTWSGSLSGTTWTITAVGSAKNPTGPSAANIARTLTRTVTYTLVPNPQVFDRIYDGNVVNGNTGCTDHNGVTLKGLDMNKTVIAAPLTVNGGLCLRGSTGQILTNTNGDGRVDIAGELVLATASNSIGTSGAHLQVANIGGGCKYVSTWHALCHGSTPTAWSDNVFADSTSQTVDPTLFVKPTEDFAAEYSNAAPGPMHPCDASLGSTGTPPTFDTTPADGYGGTGSNADITPTNSYICKATDAAGQVGELSWNASTHVLTVTGVIFFDGGMNVNGSGVSVPAANPGKSWAPPTVVHYQGLGSIFFANRVIFDTEYWCNITFAGNCTSSPTATNMANWNPSVATLWLLSGGKCAGCADDINFPGGAFQGGIYTVNKCHIHGGGATGPFLAGPLICSEIIVDGTGTAAFAFPPVNLFEGGTSSATIDLTVNGDQSG